MYIRPEDVLSPRDKVKNLEIIRNNDKEDYSIALLEYDGIECVGVRWNTTNEEKDYPLSAANLPGVIFGFLATVTAF